MLSLLRDLPEGSRLRDSGVPDLRVEAVRWIDAQGERVRIIFDDGSMREGSGLQTLSLADGVATPENPPLTWDAPSWGARVDEAWQAYILADADAAARLLDGVDAVEFTGDYDAWTPVESGVVLLAMLRDDAGDSAAVERLTRRLDVEDRAAYPKAARKVLLRRFDEELPGDPVARIRELARRWARAESCGLDGAEDRLAQKAVLAELRG